MALEDIKGFYKVYGDIGDLFYTLIHLFGIYGTNTLKIINKHQIIVFPDNI